MEEGEWHKIEEYHGKFYLEAVWGYCYDTINYPIGLIANDTY